MASTIRIKRSTGSTAPGSLANAELAYSEGADKLYVGVGTGGANGSATTVYQIASGSLFTNKNANIVYAGPATGSASVPAFRSLVAADIPTLPATQVTWTGSADGYLENGAAVNSILSSFNSAISSLQAAPPAHSHGQITNAGAIGSSANLPLITTTNGVITVGLFGTATNTFCQGNDSRLSDSRAPSGSAGGDLTGTYPSPTLSAVGTSGTYTKVTTDTKGRVTSGTTLAASDIPTLTAAKISDFDTQVRTNRLDQMAAPTASVSMNSQRLTSLAEPTGAQDAATKSYVDAVKTGLDVKDSVRMATTENIDDLTDEQSIDGVTPANGDRVLVKNQTIASQNGIYTVNLSGAWSRASDCDQNAEVTPGLFVFVEEGTVNADSAWVLTSNVPITIGTTGLTFAQFSGAGQITDGSGLSKTGNTLNVVAGTGITVANDDVALTGQALALHNLATNGVIARTGAGTVAGRTITGTAGSVTVTNGDGVSGNPTISLDATLAALAAVATSADQLIYATGSDTFATTGLTTFGRSLIDDADNTAARTTLGLGSMATQAASNVSITGGTIDGITFDGGSW